MISYWNGSSLSEVSVKLVLGLIISKKFQISPKIQKMSPKVQKSLQKFKVFSKTSKISPKIQKSFPKFKKSL